VQLLKQDLEIVSIDEGRQIDCSAEQEEKAVSPRLEILEPAANVKIERFVHSRKQDPEIV
jgi:hypothetical protein